jgi:anthranilate synthase component 2
MIDNYDSFTFNIVQYMSELGATLKVVRNDEMSPQQIRDLNPEKIVVSPGPCTPNEAGISVDVIKEFHSSIPILGVCLGHQSIAQAFGGKIVRAKKVMHGKVSQIHHNNSGVFDNLDQDFTATRYHSLVVERHSLPSCFEVTAWTYDEANDFDEIMGIRHRDFPVEGVQFHPESILTEHGHLLFKNFLENKV